MKTRFTHCLWKQSNYNIFLYLTKTDMLYQLVSEEAGTGLPQSCVLHGAGARPEVC